MVRRQLVAIAFAATALVAACASFSAEPTAEPDAAAPFESGAPVDAPADASVEAAVDADAGRFCDSHREAGLCADFDEGDPVLFHFIEMKGMPTVDMASSVSPPASMRTVASANVTFVNGRANAAALATRQRLTFETYLGALDGEGGVTADSVLARLVENSSSCSFGIESFGAAGARLIVSVPLDGGMVDYSSYPMSAFPPPGRWARVDLQLESKAGGVIATVTVAGVGALAPTMTLCRALTSSVDVVIGLIGTSVGAPTTGEAHFDNVLFDSK